MGKPWVGAGAVKGSLQRVLGEASGGSGSSLFLGGETPSLCITAAVGTGGRVATGISEGEG